MKRIMITGLVLLTGSFTFAQNAKSDIEERLESFNHPALKETFQAYMQPFADAFGGNMNSGLYHTAKVHKDGLHFYIGVETLWAFISNKQRKYSSLIDDPPSSLEVTDKPTIFGSDEAWSVDIGNQTFSIPGGKEIRALPVIAPRLTIGSVMGTELSFRLVSLDLPKNFGLLKITGYGLRHSISQYIPLSPIDICFGFFIQDFELGRVFKAQMNFFGAQASRSLGPLTIYGGLGIEKTTLTIGNAEGLLNIQPLTFDSDNRGRMNVGVCLSMLILKVHADYTIGNQNVVVLGVGIGM